MNAVLALDHALCECHPQRHPRSPKRFKHPRGAGSGGQHLKGPAVVPPMLCPILPLSTVPICRPAYPSCCRLTQSGGQGRRKYENSENAGPALGRQKGPGGRGMGSGWYDLMSPMDGGLDVRRPGSFSRWSPTPDARHDRAWQRRRRVCLSVHSRVISGRARRWVPR